MCCHIRFKPLVSLFLYQFLMVVHATEMVTITAPKNFDQARNDVTLLHEYGSFNLYKIPKSNYSSLQSEVKNQTKKINPKIEFDALAYDPTKDFVHIPLQFQINENQVNEASIHLVRFVGPIKQQWLDVLEKTGAKLIQYVRNNAYLVWADKDSRSAIKALSEEGSIINAEGLYQPFLKQGATISSRLLSEDLNAVEKIRISFQLVDHPAIDKSKQVIESLSLDVISPWTRVLSYHNITVVVFAKDIETIVKRHDVYSALEYFDRELTDEVQGQIIAGNLNVGNTGPSGTGYLPWLLSKGFSTNQNDYPIVDVVDDGIGNGSIVNGAGDDTLTVLRDGVTTRLDHVDNCTSDATGEGLDGHGHININIVGGYDQRSGFPFRDPNGYQRGQGINPYGRLAGTRIFDTVGFDLSSCGGADSDLIKSQQDNGSLISSNSWGCGGCAGSYDSSSQAFDVGVRDADLTEAGNQQMIMLFAAGNDGSGATTIGTPGNGKNMITVGASENNRPTDEDGNWTDGCGIDPTGANSAMDVIGFSSRGPAPGGRTKPEIIAPGTHIQGTASTNGGYTGGGVCDQFRPSGQTVFASSSGTSHSTPAAAGVASLYYYWLQNTHGQANPTPSLMKAYMIAHPTYLTGVSANDDLPSNSQGYGMPNMELAFNNEARVIENEVTTFDNTGETWTWSGSVANTGEPIRLVLAYTDAAGATGTSPEVNNLNLTAIIDGNTYVGNNFSGAFSVLGGAADADNNYEAIFLPAGTSGTIDITVTAANISGDGVPNSGDGTDQDFSIVCYNCSQQPDYNLNIVEPSINVCVDPGPILAPNVTINTTSVLGFSTPINLGFNPLLPTGFSASFSLNPVVPGSSSSLGLTVDSSASVGTHNIIVEGNASGNTKQDSFDVVVSFPVASSPTLTNPFDGETGVVIQPTFNWGAISGALSYDIDIATDAAFITIIDTATTPSNNYTTALSLNASTQYFWRVRANNNCGNGNYSNTSSFTTANIVNVELCSTPGANIPDNNVAGLNDTIIFPQDITVTDVDIKIDISHTWVSDLSLTVTNNGTTSTTTIIDRPNNCSSDDIDTTIDDDNGTPVENECSVTPPAIGAGPFTPNNPLSVFDGEAAMNNWTLNVRDHANQDTGTLNEWCIVVTGTPILPTPDINFSGSNLSQDVCLDPGPTSITPVTLNVTSLNNYNNPITLAFNPVLPTGISGNFSNNSFIPAVAPGTDSLLNMMVTSGATSGINTVTIEASGAAIATQSVDLDLNVVFALAADPSISTPTSGTTGVAINTTLNWLAVSGATSYDIDVATDSAFTTIVASTTTASTNYTPGSLVNGTVYYWRVRASNLCGDSGYIISAFETIGGSGSSTSTTCSNPALAIPDATPAGTTDTLNIASGGTITDIDISLDVTHSWVGDLVANVSRPLGTAVTILERPGIPPGNFGCGGDNIDTIIDDGSGVPVEGVCAGGNPTIGTGPFSPNNALSAFNTEISNGDWVITISDNAGGDTGTLNEWCVIATVDTGSSLAPADYSDLDSSYGVAKHEGGGVSRLGNNWTADSGFAQDADTTDDDGITASGMWLPGSTTAQLSVESTGGYLACWFDWNNDGTFAIGEKSVAQAIASPGPVVIPVTIPVGSTFGNTGDDFLESRCRFYSAEPSRGTEIATGTTGSGEVEDYRFLANDLTPVTLAFSQSSKRGSSFSLEWSTTTEAGTVAFNVHGLINNVWKKLNNIPISAKGTNSTLPNHYNFQVNSNQITLYKIEELTTQGLSRMYGPYGADLTYGKYPVVENINWQQVKNHSTQSLQTRQNAMRGSFDFIKVKVSKTGLHRISYEQLLTLGVDWQGYSSAEIAIEFENTAVARYISADTFAPGVYIEFVGKAAQTLYTDTNIYQLSLKPTAVKVAQVFTHNGFIIDENAYHMAEAKIDGDNEYSFASPAQSPWFYQKMLAYTDEKRWQFPLATPNLLNNGTEPLFDYRAWGGTDWPQATVDHHIQIEINEQQLIDSYGNGTQIFEASTALPENLLQQQNIVTVILPADTGVDHDLIQLDSLRVSYPSEIVVQNGQLQFIPNVTTADLDLIYSNGFELVNTQKTQTKTTNGTTGFVVSGLSQENISVYVQDNGTLNMFENINPYPDNGGFAVELPHINGEYYISENTSIELPNIELATTNQLERQGSYDYLMIAHPDFEATLNQLASYHQSNGLSVLVTNTDDIYANYSHHRISAQAIKSYIEDVSVQMGIQAVLLVGGDSYDYMNNLNIGSISHIPTLYHPVDSLVKFAPVDPLYVDINNDLVPDLSLGRLPVRTNQELQNSIDKMVSFANRDYNETALFATDRGLSFDEFSDQIISTIPESWFVETAYINQLEINGAQQAIKNGIENGTTFTSFFGHSGPGSWSFERLFDTDDVLALNNSNKPTVVNQFGCWNTYYVTPMFDTMSHRFMQLENKGAVAVMGASTLTESFHELELGIRLIPNLTHNNMTIGEAILQAKQNLAVSHPDYLDVILGWTLLGDPMIEVNN